MGCVRFSLAGDTAKVWGEPGRDLLGSGPGLFLRFFLCPVSTLWCACFLKLPFCQVEGAEALWPGWEAKGLLAQVL